MLVIVARGEQAEMGEQTGRAASNTFHSGRE